MKPDIKPYLPFAVCMILIVLITAVTSPAVAKPPSDMTTSLDPTTQFYVPLPNHGAIEQIAALTAAQNRSDAVLIQTIIDQPGAVWFTGGSPKRVSQDVKAAVQRAAGKGTVPVLVAYNLPFRDCSQYSAGGAISVDAYKAWIDGFAAGIGDHQVVVILEPDGLGIVPWYQPFGSGSMEWCQPAEADPVLAASDRFAMLNYAVDAIKTHPNASVYLDGTHSAWLGVGDIADRLVMAGVQRADGFFLNTPNYQYSVNLTMYGKWISACIAASDPANRGSFSGCANQYWNGGPEGTKIAELLGPWTGVALSPYGEWSDDSDDPALNTSGINARYGSFGSTHFVIDTSRNGQGPWLPPAGAFPDAQDWCNPPERGLGLLPTAGTGEALLDAYLWIKVPGESDGQCTRGTSGPLDPARGMIDPPAGAWFPEMALELSHNANPPLP